MSRITFQYVPPPLLVCSPNVHGTIIIKAAELFYNTDSESMALKVHV